MHVGLVTQFYRTLYLNDVIDHLSAYAICLLDVEQHTQITNCSTLFNWCVSLFLQEARAIKHHALLDMFKYAVKGKITSVEGVPVPRNYF